MDGWMDGWIDLWMVCGQETVLPNHFFFVAKFCHLVTHKKRRKELLLLQTILWGKKISPMFAIFRTKKKG